MLYLVIEQKFKVYFISLILIALFDFLILSLEYLRMFRPQNTAKPR